jgi:hypothetical protein
MHINDTKYLLYSSRIFLYCCTQTCIKVGVKGTLSPGGSFVGPYVFRENVYERIFLQKYL